MNQTQLTDSGIVVACRGCGQQNRLKFEKLGDSFRCGKCHLEIGPRDHPLDITNDSAFFAALEACAIPILVDFWAPWCGPCKMVAPEVSKFAAGSMGKMLVFKVNTESSPLLAQRYNITGIPTFILFKGGKPIARTSGAMSAIQMERFASSAV